MSLDNKGPLLHALCRSLEWNHENLPFSLHVVGAVLKMHTVI